MKKMVGLILALGVLMAFSFGCSIVPRETKVKCPNCGNLLTADEGMNRYRASIGAEGF